MKHIIQITEDFDLLYSESEMSAVDGNLEFVPSIDHENKTNSRSQSLQDKFALQICKNKSYIEIGANSPTVMNNTFLLEQNEFLGFSVELNDGLKKKWDKTGRKNTIIWSDALTLDYSQIASSIGLTKNIGYLSCDIEPPRNTFLALKKVIEEGFVFECITFEHDIYQSKDNYDKISREYLESVGYKVAVENVYVGNNSEQIFETWFVKEDIEFTKIDYTNWKHNLLNGTNIL